MRLSEIHDQKLRRGIELLLDPDPNRRKEVYMIWGIENKEKHFLTPLNEEKVTAEMDQHSQRDSNIHQKKRTNSKVNLNPQPQEVPPRQVESIYIPAPNYLPNNMPNNVQPRSRTPTNVHFSHQEQEQPNRANVGVKLPQAPNYISNATSMRQSQ